MALYINKLEAAYRIGNGFLSNDGYVNGQMFNIYRRNGIDTSDPYFKRIIKCVMAVLDSMDENGVEIYPTDLRGAKLREIRKEQGMTGTWVALKAGLSKTTIYDIEKGLTVPRQATLAKIAKALHVSIEELG